MHRRTSFLIRAGLSLVLFVPCSRAAAQTDGWRATVAVSGNSIFGASSQSLASFASSVSHAGSAFTSATSVEFRYGESEGADAVKFVSSRSWATTLALDVTPHGRFSPFVLGNAEASLEKRIQRRLSGGAGAKWVFSKTSRSTGSLSLALLAERTRALNDTIAPTTLARWSWRLRFDVPAPGRLAFTHTTFYAPEFRTAERYTVKSVSTASVAISKPLSLTLTFRDNYDSQARLRGARTNNDGSVEFGIRASFQ